MKSPTSLESMLTDEQAKLMQLQAAGLSHEECADILQMSMQQYTANLTIAASVMGTSVLELA